MSALPESPVTRRTAVCGLLAACGTAALAGCGGGGGSPAAGPPAQGSPLVSLADVPVGKVVSATTADGAKVLVARPGEDEVVAFSAICTHQGCTVEPSDDGLRCPCHGSAFEPLTGEVVQGPAESALPRVEVQVVDGQVRTV